MNTRRNLILIVDDIESDRAVLRAAFENQYKIAEAADGKEAFDVILKHHAELTAVLLDLIMPVMDGFEVMRKLREGGFLSEFPVIIITAESNTDTELKSFDMGASEIIRKPFAIHIVMRRVQNLIDLNNRKLEQENIIEEKTHQIRESYTDMVDALSSIIEFRSLETGQHLKRIRLLTRTLLEETARSDYSTNLTAYAIHLIEHAASMHDIGKIAISDSILNKPGKLTPEEFNVMKTHTTKGCEMLSDLNRLDNQDFLRYAYEICRYHHERWDGKGYPDGLSETRIPLCAQVVGIADCYDALTNDRCYKKAISPDKAIEMIINGECGMFAPKLLDNLWNIQAQFMLLSEQYKDTNL